MQQLWDQPVLFSNRNKSNNKHQNIVYLYISQIERQLTTPNTVLKFDRFTVFHAVVMSMLQVLREKEKNSGFVKPKPVKPHGLSTMRKASSTQSIDMGSNTSGSMKSVSSNKSASSQKSIKRAQSTQNVSKVGGSER